MYKVRTIKAQEDYAMDGKLSRLKCRVYTQVRWAQTEEHRLKLKYALTSAHVDKAYTCLLSHTHIKIEMCTNLIHKACPWSQANIYSSLSLGHMTHCWDTDRG